VVQLLESVVTRLHRQSAGTHNVKMRLLHCPSASETMACGAEPGTSIVMGAVVCAHCNDGPMAIRVAPNRVFRPHQGRLGIGGAHKIMNLFSFMYFYLNFFYVNYVLDLLNLIKKEMCRAARSSRGSSR
jgi:hypothetical protein